MLSAAFPARRAMKRASRQILTALPPSASLSLSLPPRTGAKPMGAVSARVVGGWYRVGALPTVGDPTSHFGRLAGTMWPVSEGERGEATKEKVIQKDGIYSHHLHRSRGQPPRQSELSYCCLFMSFQADRKHYSSHHRRATSPFVAGTFILNAFIVREKGRGGKQNSIGSSRGACRH